MDPPARAPNKLASIKANDEPNNTATGLLDVPLSVRVANWVLSPSSAIKTVIKIDISKFIIILI